MLSGARLSLAICLLLAGGFFPVQGQTQLESFARDRLAIETADGDRHDIEIELAVTPRQQAQGLMYRRDLAVNAGMLFLYGRDRPVSMWMKNTLIPLDMLFLARDGRVLRVVERTVPHSLATISSGEAVAAVLELNSGAARRLGVAVGDRVLYGLLGGGS